MTTFPIGLLISIIILMAFSAFFSGMEIAFVSSNRMLAEVDKQRGGIGTRLVRHFYAHPNGFVSTMLVGNNIVLVAYGILFARLVDQTCFRGMDAAFTVPADTILSTLVILFTGEFLPKTFFKNNPNTLLAFFAPLAAVFYVVLWPISRMSTALAKVGLKAMGVKQTETVDDDGFSKVDLDYLVQTSLDSAPDNNDQPSEVRIFQNALDFPDTKVRDCMVPRTEVNAVAQDTPEAELLQRFIESGHSKIVVYEGDIDHIIGYIHSSEMFRHPARWADHVRQMPIVPETMAAQKLMQMMMQQKKTLAVVVDEFGGTAGIVALEDIVEEIFGDIEDEHDTSKYTAERTPEGDYLLSARLEIDKINELFDLGLPESDDYMTLSGYILHTLESLPKLNDVVDLGAWEAKIVKASATRIELVRLKKKG